MESMRPEPMRTFPVPVSEFEAPRPATPTSELRSFTPLSNSPQSEPGEEEDDELLGNLPLIEEFAEMAIHYQMISLSREAASNLGKRQQGTLKKALKDGFEKENLYRKGTVNLENQRSFKEREIFIEIDNWIADFLGPYFFQWSSEERDRSLLMKCSQVKKLYELIHSSDLKDSQKLFFEFYIGLTIVFRLNTLISIRLVQESDLLSKSQNVSYKDFLEDTLEGLSNDFWTHLIQCKELALMMQTILFSDVDLMDVGQLGQHLEQKWKLIYELVVNNPCLHQALEFLCSMRYIPNEKSFLLAAQILHWRGFGNEGEWLKVVPELRPFLELPIRYHAGKKRGHFAGEQVLEKMFLPILGAMRKHRDKLLEACGEAYFQTQAQGEDKMVVMDCGSGKNVAAVAALKKKYQDLIYLIAMDGCGDSLSGIHESNDTFAHQPSGESLGFKVDQVAYQDINALSSDQQTLHDQIYTLLVNGHGPCHLLSTFLVLHQCMDHSQGHEILAKFLYYATCVLHVGGIWFWGDTGDVAYLQGLIIPANLVDREGYVPNNLYKFLENLVFAEIHNNCFRLLLPLKVLHFSRPQSLATAGGIYTFNAFLNVEVDENVLHELETLLSNAKNEGKWGEFDCKVEEIVESQDCFGMFRRCKECIKGGE